MTSKISMKDQVKAVLLALAAVLLWSTAGSAFKITLRYTSPVAMLLLSAGVATVSLAVMTVYSGSWRAAFRLSPRLWIMSALMGLLNPFLYYAILFVAYDRLLAQEALVLNYLWPVILVLLSIPMLKQRVAWYQWAGIVISFSGTIIIATQGDMTGFRFTDALGVGLAAGSALIWALYWILNLKDVRANLPKLLLNFGFGWLYVLLYFLISGVSLPVDSRAWAGSVYIGLFEMGITFALWLGA
ncbi:MAG: EamA family transporter, partial [Bacteroidales bacterium]|nr:EamA family transporter [Bacteroidales bacterium]